MKEVEWGEFRVGDLLEFSAVKQAKSQKLIPTDDTEQGIPYIVQSTKNNMFSRNVNRQYLVENNEPPISGNKIVLGVTLPAVSYQPREFGASQVITATASWLNAKNGVYVATAISKLMYLFSYASKPGMQVYKNLKIKLPSKQGKPDFQAMERFVEQLEAQRLRELKAYLLATGLKDTTLTKEEQKALDVFMESEGGESDEIKWHEIKIDELFEVYPSKSYPVNDAQILDDRGCTPYVSNQSQNNGYIGWSLRKPLNEGNVITLSDTWQSERTIFYQPEAFIGKSHLQVMRSYSAFFNQKVAFFMISSFRYSILNLGYDYGTKFNRGKIKNTRIALPVGDKQSIDYTFMNTFISAIQKIVIADVVGYADDKINGTKQAISPGDTNE